MVTKTEEWTNHLPYHRLSTKYQQREIRPTIVWLWHYNESSTTYRHQTVLLVRQQTSTRVARADQRHFAQVRPN